MAGPPKSVTWEKDHTGVFCRRMGRRGICSMARREGGRVRRGENGSRWVGRWIVSRLLVRGMGGWICL